MTGNIVKAVEEQKERIFAEAKEQLLNGNDIDVTVYLSGEAAWNYGESYAEIVELIKEYQVIETPDELDLYIKDYANEGLSLDIEVNLDEFVESQLKQ